jgi:hypothetical protein
VRRHRAGQARFPSRRLRRLWPDHNPLRRPWDRAETAIVAGLLAAFLVGAPLAAIVAGQWVRSAGLRDLQAEQASRHWVPAVLLGSAGVPLPTGYGPLEPQVRARWTAPDGVPRTGQISVPAGALAGQTVHVWVDTAGRLAGPPLRHAQVAGQAVIAAVLAPLVLGLVLLCLGGLSRLVLDRRRLAAWDADWRATGPHWTRRHQAGGG